MKKIVLLWVLATVFTASAWGLKNPAAVYCSQLGYEYTINQTPEGDVGVCGSVMEQTALVGISCRGCVGYSIVIAFRKDMLKDQGAVQNAA